MTSDIRRFALVCVFSLMGLLLAACGGGSDTGDEGADVTAAVTDRESAQAALGPIPNGGSATGAIGAAGVSNSHTFTATAGQSLILSVARTSGTLSPAMTLFAPNGVRLTGTSGAIVASLSHTAATSGTYTVVVQHRTSAAGIGNYQLHYARGAGANEHGLLINGGLKAETITVGDLDSYTFTATAGQSLLLSVARTSGAFSPSYAVFGPNGQRLTGTSGALVASLNFTAATTGTYTVVVQNRSDNGAIGTYQIHYARGAGANEHGLLINGGVKAETITVGDLDSYTFTASAGQGLLLSVARTSGTFSPAYYVYGPNGQRLTSTSGALVASLNFVAATTGTYTVVVLNRSDDGASGGYQIHYARGAGANEHGLLVNGGLKAETITAGDLDSYTFTATAGQGLLLSVARTSGTFSPAYYLYGPNGQRLTQTSGALVASLSFTAATTGTYTVVVLNRSDNGATGGYEIHYARGTGANEGGLLTRGVSKSGAITIGDLDSYTVNGVAGGAVAITVTRTAGTFGPAFYVYGPNGARLTSTSGAAGASVAVSTPTTGTYTVVVLNRTDDGAIGSYLITAN